MRDDDAIERRCPRCHQAYSIEPDQFTKHWYKKKSRRRVMNDAGDVKVIEVVLPSTYCKSCEKERVLDARRLKFMLSIMPPAEQREMELMSAGPCGCCGGRRAPNDRTLIEHPSSGFRFAAVCRECRALLEESDMDVAMARARWMHLFKHVAREREAVQQWQAAHDGSLSAFARTRRPHETYPVGRGVWRAADPAELEGLPYDHRQCVMDEWRWRKALRWLTSKPEPELASVTSISALAPNPIATPAPPPPPGSAPQA